MNKIKSRNTLLVILWSYGLFILMHIYQYAGTAIAAWKTGQSFEAIISGELESARADFIISLTALIIGIPLIFLVTRFLWRRSAEWMRIRFAFKQFRRGVLFGFLLPFLILMILGLIGIAKVYWRTTALQSTDAQLIFLGYACLAIFTGLAEEVVFRGMAVREIALRHGWLMAAIIGGLYFGAAHLLANMRDLAIVEAVWVLLAGTLVSFLFVAMYRRSRSLWMPIGFHVAWNFCLKGVMGITISGNEAGAGLLHVELTGSSILTGGNFGMETSLVSLVVYVLAAVMFLKVPPGGQVELLGDQYGEPQ